MLPHTERPFCKTLFRSFHTGTKIRELTPQMETAASPTCSSLILKPLRAVPTVLKVELHQPHNPTERGELKWGLQVWGSHDQCRPACGLRQPALPGDGPIDVRNDNFIIPVPQINGAFAATRALILCGNTENHVIGAILQLQAFLKNMSHGSS